MSRTDPLPAACDVVVVGGGIIGLAVARELLKRHSDLDLCVIEAEDRVAAHQSSHNSGVIHAGVYYDPGSLRAGLCVDGALMLEGFCAEHGVPYQHVGKLIVAVDERELPRLDELERRGRANGVRGLARLGPDGIEAIEPGARGLAALHSPFTGITDFRRVAEALAAEVERRGGRIRTGATVTGVDSGAAARTPPRSPAGDPGLGIHTGRGTTRAGQAVFCAGLAADRLARMTGGDPVPRIVPFRGAYLRVDPVSARSGSGSNGPDPVVRGNVYPVPDPALPFLGAHLTPTLDGAVLIGPTAMPAGARDAYSLSRIRVRDLAETLGWPGTWRLVGRHPGSTVSELLNTARPRRLLRQAARMVPAVKSCRVTHAWAGVRAQALGRDGRLVEDFLLEQTGSALHVRNAPSPAATSSLALAGLIADRVG
ncbi:MAG: L-2-hydroxyglutarate oxidase [Solirubrobacterales bacterium]|nr:L-2-hydroxyglutarate oxidase [Solirubrobacterales bacterium]